MPYDYGYGPMYPVSRPRSSLPIAGGVLLIVAAALAFVDWGLLFAMSGTISSMVPGFDIGDVLILCGAIGIILALFALIGGVMALQRKMWGLALTGAILGLFTIGPALISSILSLVALILIATSHHEFT